MKTALIGNSAGAGRSYASTSIAVKPPVQITKNIQPHCIQKRKSYGHHRSDQKAGRNILDNDNKQGAYKAKNEKEYE